jgi:Holliday junction DNA helicase RuvA
MISSLTGDVTWVGVDRLIVDVGGVGLSLSCTPQTALSAKIGFRQQFATVLVVREDSLTLYGFDSTDARDTFEAVQTVSGIGPRIALALLATLTPDELRRAVHNRDHAQLTKVPGVGAKSAQRMVLELSGRLGPPSNTDVAAPIGSDWREGVCAGLESLGWSRKDAERAVSAIAERQDVDLTPATPDIGALLKAALQELDRA